MAGLGGEQGSRKRHLPAPVNPTFSCEVLSHLRTANARISIVPHPWLLFNDSRLNNPPGFVVHFPTRQEGAEGTTDGVRHITRLELPASEHAPVQWMPMWQAPGPTKASSDWRSPADNSRWGGGGRSAGPRSAG